MDKTAIKNFAIEARKILMKTAINKAGFYGITNDGISEPIQKGPDFEIYKTVAGTENRIYGSDIKRRRNLVEAINGKGFDEVIEETAYTWFNRIIAIRFMEVNDYLPTRTRVLSSETGNNTPDIVSQYLDVNLNMSEDEIEKVRISIENNRYDDAFQFLFVKQCNELNDILPGLFEKTNDYMELLLDISYTSDGVVRMLVDEVEEENFNVEKEGQVEIIGWLYQYYNTELKDDTFAKLKKNVKITKERIPAATQLFTPDWIVRYMVENSLGRVWIDHLRALDETADEMKLAESFGWKYYLPEAEQEPEVVSKLVKIRSERKDLKPQDITCIDPCMGSGHILVYMFDVLLQIYESEGISVRDAVFNILEKNIHGLDIDVRAYQLSYFALMMKGRGAAGRRFFRGVETEDGINRPVFLKVYAIDESNNIDRSALSFLGKGILEEEKNLAETQLNRLLDEMIDAKEYGSIIKISNFDLENINKYLSSLSSDEQLTIGYIEAVDEIEHIKKIINICQILRIKYDAVITNPPYMGSNGMATKLNSFIKKNYEDSKSDLSTVFMESTIKMLNSVGYISMINIPVWMFLTSYEKLRVKISNNNMYINMLHLGRGIFGSDFGTTAFVIYKTRIKKYLGTYMKLYEKQGSVDSLEEKQAKFLRNESIYYNYQENFEKIPGEPLGYWLSDSVVNAFADNPKMSDCNGIGKKGLSTGNNDKFLRLWFEVDKQSIGVNLSKYDARFKWIPINKGGAFRKWYGNNDYVINWMNDGEEIKRFSGSVIRNPDYYFKESITWTMLSASCFGVRYSPVGKIFEGAGPSLFSFDNMIYYNLALLCSKVGDYFIRILNPTININIGDVCNIPVVKNDENRINVLSKENISLSREEWDSYELSWDFKRHPLVDMNCTLLSEAYEKWEELSINRFNIIKNNEETINDIFINSYGIGDCLDKYVDDENVTIRVADRKQDIKSLLSYAVGCMFGRYSLDENGVVYAGGDIDYSRYKSFSIDDDAIIPITDEEYFNDDIVKRLIEFIKVAFGENTLEKNIKYIADSLENKGDSSREVIRNYFINDFYNDHCNMYSVSGSGKRPIYWLFDSGKQNGFKCLIYIHRYNQDTVGLIRSMYFRKTQDAIENAMRNAEYVINTSSSAVERANATRKRDKYIKQLNEMRPYYQALTHIALQRIPMDLDDGVKKNYQLFQGVEISGEGTKNQKIDLLAKI